MESKPMYNTHGGYAVDLDNLLNIGDTLFTIHYWSIKKYRVSKIDFSGTIVEDEDIKGEEGFPVLQLTADAKYELYCEESGHYECGVTNNDIGKEYFRSPEELLEHIREDYDRRENKTEE